MSIQSPGSHNVWLAALVSAALLGGCTPSVEEVVAKNRAPVEAVFTQVKALDAKVKQRPLTTEDKMQLGAEKVVLDGEGSNALFIRAADVAAPQYASSQETGATYAGSVQACGQALTGQFMGVAGGAKLVLEECGRAKYVFVLRTGSEESAEESGKGTFRAGKYSGDVLLFRLTDGAELGAFRVGAQSSADVHVLDKDAAAGRTDERLESDLSANLFVDIKNKLNKFVPGSVKP
jgi:hypothetical protein